MVHRSSQTIILTDAFGNNLSFSGSMNESSAALERNGENIVTTDSWTSEADAEDLAGLGRNFQAMWEDEHPNFVVPPNADVRRTPVQTGGTS